MHQGGAGALGQAQHVDHALHADFGRLHRVEAGMPGVSRVGEVEDRVDLDMQRPDDVVALHLEMRMTQEMGDVAPCPGGVVVDAQDLMAGCQQRLAHMAPDEASRACDQNASKA